VRAVDFAFERFGLLECEARFVLARARNADAARSRASYAPHRRRHRRRTSEVSDYLSLRLLD
jgi:hypothetical protein